MAYRNKVYVCFDADNDMKYYRTLQMWRANNNINFDFHDAHDLNNLRNGSNEQTIKRKLRERMANSKMLVVLVGEKTKNLYKYVRWEIEIALEKYEIPVLVVNLNNKREFDGVLCPPILDRELALHISFEQKMIKHAIENWGAFHEKKVKEPQSHMPHSYPKAAYDALGV